MVEQKKTAVNIALDTKVGRKALNNMIDLFSRHGMMGGRSEHDVANFIRDYRKGKATALELAEVVNGCERARQRAQTREWLESHRPESILAKAINTLNEDLDEWFDKAKKDPYYQLSWGGDAFQKAAKLKVYKEIQYYLFGTEETPVEPTRERWNEIINELQNEVLRGIRSNGNSQSTSRTSNLAEDCLLAAKAAMTAKDDWTTAEIGWWYDEKARYDAGEE